MKYWLVLGGWGARGIAHIWVLKYLEENNIEITEVAWTSMWAIVAAWVATWLPLESLINFAEKTNYLRLIDPDLKTWLIKGQKITEELQKLFGETLIEKTHIPLKIITTNVETSESVILEKWRIVDALRASMSIPWVFMPQKINWVSHVDWWIMMNLPIQVLESENIIAVSALKINTGKIEKTKQFLWLTYSSWFFRNNFEIIKRSIISLMKVNEDVSLATPWKKVLFMRPSFWKLDIIDFHKSKEFIEIWYSEAEKSLRELLLK